MFVFLFCLHLFSSVFFYFLGNYMLIFSQNTINILLNKNSGEIWIYFRRNNWSLCLCFEKSTWKRTTELNKHVLKYKKSLKPERPFVRQWNTNQTRKEARKYFFWHSCLCPFKYSVDLDTERCVCGGTHLLFLWLKWPNICVIIVTYFSALRIANYNPADTFGKFVHWYKCYFHLPL